jgi:hypothetical protein
MAFKGAEAEPIFLWIINIELYSIVVGGRGEDLRWGSQVSEFGRKGERCGDLFLWVPGHAFDILCMFHQDSHTFKIGIRVN